MRRFLRLALAGLVFGGVLGAQGSDTLLKRGARVRLWSQAIGYSAQQGWFEARSTDSMDLRLEYRLSQGATDTERVRIALSKLDSIHVSVRTGMTAGKGGRFGVTVGGLIGLVGGGLLAASSVSPKCQPQSYDLCGGGGRATAAMFGALGGGLLGAAVGGVVGLGLGAANANRWVAVRITH